MKRTLLLVSLTVMLFSNVSYSQQSMKKATDSSSLSETDNDKTSALKPADEQPYLFSSKEELESAVPEKIKSIKNQILSGKLTEAQIKEMREQIWRFENAAVR